VIHVFRRASRTFLPVESIGSDWVTLRGGDLRAVLECPTLAFGIKGEAEQRAVIDGWAALLNSLTHPLGIVIRSRRFDPRKLTVAVQTDAHARWVKLHESYTQLIEQLSGQQRVVDRRFFVIVPSDHVGRERESSRGEARAALDQRVRWVDESLRRLDLQPRRVAGVELAELLRGTVDQTSAVQPIGEGDPLLDADELVAPAGAFEEASAVQIGDLRARALAVTRYPDRLDPGWLGALQQLDGDLDVALHLHPNAGPAVMHFLERRIAELSSTVRLAEEHGARPDAYRQVALQDAVELQERIAQGSERLFDVSLYLVPWAADGDALDAATRRIEALLGSRLVHSRRLLFQMRAGVVSALPLGVDSVQLRRVLPTSAVAATFPFDGSDLPARSGLLYGINVMSRSPVVLDRFALENHNAVVFATSGAGKSYLVKVELARAALAGHRALVIDPEGEYATLLAQLGAAVVPIGPGAGAGLDPFAIVDGAPGRLSARVAMLTTLVELLVAGLQPGERAAVAGAISAAYARAGFADGTPITGLGSPQFAEIRDRLRAIAGMQPVAARLDRYVSGSGSWLFQRRELRDVTAETSVVYTLAGLPEEDRAVAMFLVLDRIWQSLANANRPTLVVVDEAWWLMRHPDTAAFLFRLVKTARKRRAGLTLVTQDVGDVLSSPDGEAVIANAALQILMKQAPQAMPRLAELFRLTRAEQTWLLNAQRGDGLLVAQGRRVPFHVVASEEEARLIDGQPSPA
jgi:hypothetical protein